MTGKLVTTLALLVFGGAPSACARASLPITEASGTDIVRVAAPTGERETDRASILAALEQVRPGGTVQFAPGTYLTGGTIRVSVAGVTLLGHAEGTTLRGCDPEEPVDYEAAPNRCAGLELVAGHQTVRGFTFERMSWASIQIAAVRGEGQARRPNTIEGGHLIEGNTFRDSDSFNVIGEASDPVVIRDNVFINTYHAVAISGSNVHVLENMISAPEPQRIPYGRADIAVGAAQFERDGPKCADNVIAGNRIEGHTEGIALGVFAPGASCRGNVIRDNTIIIARGMLGPPERAFYAMAADSPFIGVPIRLLNYPQACRAAPPGLGVGPWCRPAESDDEGILAGNTIEGNEISGAEGIAIEVLYASGNRIVNNAIRGTRRWQRFPDGVLRHPPQWREGNGAGIWVSAGSDENEILGNTFEALASHAIVLEGSRNRVEVGSTGDSVRDTGSGNAILRKGSGADLDVGLSSEKLHRLSDQIAGWVADGDVVGAELLIIKDGRAVLHEAYGWSDRERQAPVVRNSIWSLKSMTKPVTATAVLMLAEEGKLSLDDPVTRYIPGFAGDSRVTVRHLLTQTSGIDGGMDGGAFDVYFFDSLAEWVADQAGREPGGNFGAFGYADPNYTMLGYIVESVAGQSAETFTENRILAPLGMRETFTAFTPDVPWAARVNSRYRWDPQAGKYERYWSNADLQPWSIYPAAFGLWGSATDYARFLAMWLNRGDHGGVGLLRPETVAEALKPDRAPYGYGWHLQPSNRSDAVPLAFLHDGADGTVAIALPADDAQVIYLSHSMGRDHLQAFLTLLGALGIFEYPGPRMMPADEDDVARLSLSPAERAVYAGTYRGAVPWAPAVSMVVEVRDEGEHLHARVGPAGSLMDQSAHLVPRGANEFVQGRYEGDRIAAIDPSFSLRFVLEGDRASAVELVVGGRVMVSAPRVDPETLRAEIEAEHSRVSIADIVATLLDADGIDTARARYRALHSARPDSIRFAASLLNSLGHRLLHRGRIAEAVAVLELNAESYPDSPSTHGALGDAYVAAGRVAEARTSYERALALARDKEPMHVRTYRGRLERLWDRR